MVLEGEQVPTLLCQCHDLSNFFLFYLAQRTVLAAFKGNTTVGTKSKAGAGSSSCVSSARFGTGASCAHQLQNCLPVGLLSLKSQYLNSGFLFQHCLPLRREKLLCHIQVTLLNLPSLTSSLCNLQCFRSVLGGQTQSSFHTHFLSKLALANLQSLIGQETLSNPMFLFDARFTIYFGTQDVAFSRKLLTHVFSLTLGK